MFNYWQQPNFNYVHVELTASEKLVNLAKFTKDYIRELAFDNIVDYLMLIDYIVKNNVKENQYDLVFDLLNLNDSDRIFIKLSLDKLKDCENIMFSSGTSGEITVGEGIRYFTTTCTCNSGELCNKCHNTISSNQ